MTSIQNHIEFRLRGSLLSNGTSVTITNDIERDQVIEAENAYVVLRDVRGDLVERMRVNMSGGTMTILLRGLDQSQNDVEVPSLRREWRDGTRGYITVLASQQIDGRSDNTLQGDITFLGDVDFNESPDIGTFTPPVMTTTERDALASPENGMLIFNSTLGIGQQFVGGTRQNLGGGGTVVDASETVAGKVEIATTGEMTSGATTGSTGARVTATPATIQASIQSGEALYAGASATGNDNYVVTLTPAITAYTEGMTILFKADVANTGACTINVNGVGQTPIRSIEGAELSTGQIQANQIVELVFDGTNFVTQNTLPASSTFIGTAGEDITAGDALRFGITDLGGETISQTSTPTSGDHVTAFGQSFTPTTIGGLSEISFRVTRTVGATGTLSCIVYEDTGTTILATATNTFDVSSLTLGGLGSIGTQITYTFSGEELTPGTEYFIGVSGTTGGSIRPIRGSGNVYSGGVYYEISGATWTPESNQDLRFSITTTPVSEDTNRIYRTSAGAINTTGFIGFATDSVSENDPVGINTTFSNLHTGLTPNTIYYLSDTNGEISATPGTNPKEVGRSTSATGILVDTRGPGRAATLVTGSRSTTGVQTVSHNLGTMPSMIFCRSDEGFIGAFGVWADGAGQRSVRTTAVATNTSSAVFSAGTGVLTGTITSVTNTSISITWGGSGGDTVDWRMQIIA